MDIILPLMLLLAAGWFWSDSTRARETAIKAATSRCSQLDVQLLDQTVTLDKIRAKRNSRGQLVLMRIYRFEFCTTGSERFIGHVTLLGQHIVNIDLDHPEGKIIH